MKTARLSTDDLDQLAAAFRPSWELDDAPFTGAGTMAPADLRALQGSGGTRADVRNASQAPPIAHAPVAPATVAHAPVAQAPVARASAAPPPVAPGPAGHAGHDARSVAPAAAQAHEPEAKVVVNHGITAAHIAAAGPVPPPMAPTPLGPPVFVAPAASGSADRLAQTRIVQRAAVPAPKESTGSFDLGRSPFGRKSKLPLWIGLGAGVVTLAAVAIWAGTGSTETKAPPPAPTAIAKTAQSPLPDIPPPPPETTPTVVAAPPRTVPVSALPTAIAPVQPAAPPAAAPPPVVQPVQRPAAAPPVPPPARPVYVAPAAPKPVARPKGGSGTIVHDVPF